MNRRGQWAVLALAALVAGAPKEASARKLPPVEQCGDDPTFTAFRAELRRVAARRDAKRLTQLLAPDVLVNFGGGYGRKAFASHWELNRPAKSGLWRELTTALRLGCARVDGARVMPSLMDQFSAQNDQDAFESMIVVSPAARLRTSRRHGSPAIAILAWDVVRPIEAADDGVQIKIRLPDGREGWLNRAELRSPLDYRLVMKKRGGKWMITAFVAGD